MTFFFLVSFVFRHVFRDIIVCRHAPLLLFTFHVSRDIICISSRSPVHVSFDIIVCCHVSPVAIYVSRFHWYDCMSSRFHWYHLYVVTFSCCYLRLTFPLISLYVVTSPLLLFTSHVFLDSIVCCHVSPIAVYVSSFHWYHCMSSRLSSCY